MTLAQQLSEQGFAFLPSYAPQELTISAVSRLGTIASLHDIDNVQMLRPRALTDAPPNIYSGTYGFDAFPLHTDLAHWALPPRYFVLRCIIGAHDVATRLLDGNNVVTAIGSQVLRRALAQPRRAVDGTKPILRLLDRVDNTRLLLRWDSLFIRPATKASAAVFDMVNERLCMCAPLSILLVEPGDTLIVENWRMLHGRSAVPVTSRQRHIDRVYLGDLQ